MKGDRFQAVRGDNSAGSRFGSALARVGDVNLDGYEDVAVGAPYEAGAGAVYIYCGQLHAVNSLREEYFQVGGERAWLLVSVTGFDQKIAASEVMNGMAGFGLSISAADLDSNGYPDLVIGSYLSDQAVILR